MGGGGVQKPNFLKESMTLKGNFQRGGRDNLKNLPWEGYGYFLEQHSNPQKQQTLIAKRTKSKNRMQITEFLARLGQHERVLREIQEI